MTRISIRLNPDKSIRIMIRLNPDKR